MNLTIWTIFDSKRGNVASYWCQVAKQIQIHTPMFTNKVTIHSYAKKALLCPFISSVSLYCQSHKKNDTEFI